MTCSQNSQKNILDKIFFLVKLKACSQQFYHEKTLPKVLLCEVFGDFSEYVICRTIKSRSHYFTFSKFEEKIFIWMSFPMSKYLLNVNNQNTKTKCQEVVLVNYSPHWTSVCWISCTTQLSETCRLLHFSTNWWYLLDIFCFPNTFFLWSSLFCNTSARHERHEWDTRHTSVTRTTRVRHEWKFLILLTTLVKSYFHPYISYMERNNFILRNTFWKFLFPMPKRVWQVHHKYWAL